jgi:preprotein translocase subunit SecA
MAYPERRVERPNLLERMVVEVAALWHARPADPARAGLARLAAVAGRRMAALEAAEEPALAAAIAGSRMALRRAADWPGAVLAEAVGVVATVAARSLGKTATPPQLAGTLGVLQGRAVEMATGEGKTLVAALAAAVAGLAGTPVHVVTVNGYLAERDAATMAPLYRRLGLSCGVVTEAVPPAARRAAWHCDITLCTGKDLAFDYMRDRLASRRGGGNLRRKVARLAGEAGGEPLLRGLSFAIVDEADSVLIDEARTPLILSAGEDGGRDPALFDTMLARAGGLRTGIDFTLLAQERRPELTSAGRAALGAWEGDGPPWNVAAERERLATQALTALHLLTRGEAYLLRDGKAEIVDEFTGRILPDRSWSDGLQEMVERKEGLALSPRRSTIARMTYQRFFRRYRRLAGLSGTLREVGAELWRVYRLPVVALPPHRADRKTWHPVRGYADGAAKWRAIAAEVARIHATGAPVLIGTRSVASAAHAAAVLTAAGLAPVVLSADQDAAEAEVVARAGAPGAITVATNMAGRGTDIALHPGVVALGGLHVVVSEPHESRRIDRQLAGRCGRQGDPGQVLRFVSLDDALMLGHGATGLRAMARLGSGAIRRLASLAQHRAERLHARLRRDLLRADDWLGDATAFTGAPE